MGDSDPDDLQQELLDTGEQKGNPMTTMYDLAREEYAALGIDTEAVMEKLAAKPISVHCWQGDDVLGFDLKGACPAASRPRATTLAALAPSRS